MKIDWRPISVLPKVYPQKTTVFLGRMNSATLDVKDSKPILMRWKEKQTSYRLGNQGWKDYPNSFAGKYNYAVGYYRVYDDGEAGFEDSHGYEYTPDEWAYLPNSA